MADLSNAEIFARMKENGSRPLIVKDWHVVLTILLALGSFVAAFITLKDKADETERRVHELEQRRLIDKDQFDDYKATLQLQLNRIEAKLDKERERR